MRPRKPRNKKYDIRGFYVSPRGFCQYTHPVTKEVIPLGSDIPSAMEAAIAANERLMMVKDSTMLDKIMGVKTKQKSVNDILDFMLEHWQIRVANKKLSAKTVATYRNQVETFRREFGHLSLNTKKEAANEITQGMVSDYLDRYKNKLTMRKNVRAMLITVWTHAVGKQWANINIINSTLSYSKDIQVQRERLTLDAFKKIRSCAPLRWQNVFNFALQILQRVEDLAVLEKKQIFALEGKTFIQLTQLKSNAPLLIELGPEAIEAYKQLKDDVASKYVLHWPIAETERNRQKTGERYLEGYISKQFAAARKLAIEKYKNDNLFAGWVPAQYPTFHEIRGLGAKLYEEAGYDPDMIQCLLGHGNPETTALYLSRHNITVMKSLAGLKI